MCVKKKKIKNKVKSRKKRKKKEENSKVGYLFPLERSVNSGFFMRNLSRKEWISFLLLGFYSDVTKAEK